MRASDWASIRLSSSLALLTASLVIVAGCKPSGTVDPSISSVPSGAKTGAWAVYLALEARIADGSASEADRTAALAKVRVAIDDRTAAYAYARASVAGRVAELRGLKALNLLEEMRNWAERSIERDPNFEAMAATRMLGTLLVLAGQHLDGGDSEEGLELLESVVAAHPDDPRNHLRLAEAFVALGDPDSGFEGLCMAQAARAQLPNEEQRLLDKLVDEVGGIDALGCPDASEVEAAP